VTSLVIYHVDRSILIDIVEKLLLLEGGVMAEYHSALLQNWVAEEWLVGMLARWSFSTNQGVLSHFSVVLCYMGGLWVPRIMGLGGERSCTEVARRETWVGVSLAVSSLQRASQKSTGRRFAVASIELCTSMNGDLPAKLCSTSSCQMWLLSRTDHQPQTRLQRTL